MNREPDTTTTARRIPRTISSLHGGGAASSLPCDNNAAPRYVYGQSVESREVKEVPARSPQQQPRTPLTTPDDEFNGGISNNRPAYKGAAESDYQHIDAADDGDMDAMERRLLELEGRLGSVSDAMCKRADGGDDSEYKRVLHAKEAERRAARDQRNAELERLRLADAEMQRVIEVESLCGGIVTSLVNNIEHHYLQTLQDRKVAEEERLDRLLKEESEVREQTRREREAAREKGFAEMDEAMYTSSDPVLQEIRAGVRARYEAHLEQQAKEDEDEVAALEAKLASMMSTQRR